MRALLSIPALSIVSFVAALGCATTQQESAPQTPQAPPSTVAQAPAPVLDSPLHRATRLEDHRRPAAPAPGAVSLTGQLTYGERYDPSGWSGTSIPKAIGGGPVESIDDPYSDGSAPANGTGPSEALTPESAPSSDGSKALEPDPQK